MSEYRADLAERLKIAQSEIDALRPGPETHQREERLYRLWSSGMAGVCLLCCCAVTQLAIWREKALTAELATMAALGIVAVATVVTFRAWKDQFDAISEVNRALNPVADAAIDAAQEGYLLAAGVANRPPSGDPRQN